MSYRVFWSPHAEQRLEEILQNQALRIQLAAAAREIDQNLMADPILFGESRYDTVRVGFVLPLGVQYEVFEDGSTVVIYDLWQVDARNRE